MNTRLARDRRVSIDNARYVNGVGRLADPTTSPVSPGVTSISVGFEAMVGRLSAGGAMFQARLAARLRGSPLIRSLRGPGTPAVFEAVMTKSSAGGATVRARSQARPLGSPSTRSPQATPTPAGSGALTAKSSVGGALRARIGAFQKALRSTQSLRGPPTTVRFDASTAKSFAGARIPRARSRMRPPGS